MNAPKLDALDNILADSNKRFEIYVPKPKARINLGNRSKPNDVNGPFGYTGVSIQSDVHIFIDGNKHTLFQTGQNFNGQVGGTWMQYSNADMHMSATSNVTVSADNKLLLVAGAAQGQITALDHGENIRLVPYNSLQLHYVVDTIQTGLFEFFYGRHSRNKALTLKYFASQKKLKATVLSASKLSNKGEIEGGFLKMAARSMKQLEDPSQMPAALTAETVDSYIVPLSQAGVVPKVPDGAAGLKKLEYGFSGYYKRFDPYSYSKGGFLNGLKMVIVTLKRYADVAAKYGEALQKTILVAQAIQLMEAADSIFKAASKVQTGVTDSWPGLLTFRRATDGTWGGDGSGFGQAGVVDEAQSGAAARVAIDTDVFQTKKKKAKIESGAQPEHGWSVATQARWTLTVAWDGGSKSFDITTGGPEQAAEMTLARPALSGTSEAKSILLRVGPTAVTINLTPANTATAALFQAAVTSALAAHTRVAVTPVDGVVRVTGTAWVSLDGAPSAATARWDLPTRLADGVTQDVAVNVNGATATLTLSHTNTADIAAFKGAVTAVVTPLGGTVTQPTNSSGALENALVITPLPLLRMASSGGQNAELAPRLGISQDVLDVPQASFSWAAPRLSTTGESDVLVLAINGAEHRIALDAANTSTAALFAAALRDALDLLATVTESGNDVILRTRTTGPSASIQLQRATYRRRMAPRPSALVRGISAVGNTLTVAELVALVAEASGVKASASGDKLKLEAKKEGKGSLVRVSGDLARLVFGTDPKEDVIGDDEREAINEATVEGALKTLYSWNHELQKLPEDTRNLTRPLTNALADAIDAVSQIDKTLKKGAEIVGRGVPAPPKAVGILASDGITLGTPDRIVGSGGRGVVFIADGGTGTEDWGKFVFTENWVKEWISLNETATEKAIDWLTEKITGVKKTKDDGTAKRSLGFRVISDSAVELTGTTTAQLVALGRANVAANRPDGQKDGVGIGIARVVGSYAAEVTGYEKVVISARSKGTAGPANASKGGRVELAARCIAIGAIQGEGDGDTNQDLKVRLSDFAGESRFGIDPVVLVDKELPGTELAEDGQWNALKTEYEKAAWSDTLRANHPRTEQIELHGDEITARALPFMIKMSSKGITMGVELEPQVQIARLQAEQGQINQDIAALTQRKVQLKGARVMARGQLAVVGAPAYLLAHGPDQRDNLQQLVLDLTATIRQVRLDLAQKNADLGDVTTQLGHWQTATTTLDQTYALPRFEITRDHIRLGYTNGAGEWMVDPAANNPPAGAGIVNAAMANKGYAFLNITKSSYAVAQNPVFSMKDGVATFSNGDGVLTLDKNKATLSFKQGIVADDGSIQLQVKGGTIHLG